jgi:diaminopimelate epimerase
MLNSPARTADYPWHDLAGGTRAFIKMHGLRNHFVIVDGRSEPYRPSPSEIARICDCEVRVGADQLIVVEPPAAQARQGGAAAVSAVRRGYSDATRFRVVMRGGTVAITLVEDGSVLMEGDVAVSFTGVL